MGEKTAARAGAGGLMTLAACALLAAGALACRAGAQSEVVATYKGGTITRDDYRSWLSFAKLDDDPEQRQDHLRQIALARILGAALLARGGDRDPAVAGQLADVKDSVLFQALERRLAAEVRVSEADVDQALQENEKDRHQPRRVQLANLFKKVPRDAGPAQRQAARARIEELRRQILAGADFSELARGESDSQTRFRGGRMGIAWPGQLPPHLEKVAFQLSEGQVSEVLEHADGFTLLKCLRVLPEHTMPVEEAREKLRKHLETEGAKRRLEEVVSAALARWPMVVVDLSAEAIRTAQPSHVVARFGDRVVTGADVSHWLGGARRRLGGDDLGEPVLRTILEDRARKHAGARRAAELGLETASEVRAQVEGWGRLRILATEEMSRRVQAAFREPTEEEMKARFEKSRATRVQPARFRVSAVRFGWEDQPPPARYRRAEEELARVRSGELSFERAARELSTHPSSSRGGDLGWLTARELGVLGPNVLATVKELEVRAVGPVVQQDGGLWGLQLTGREEERPQTFEEARLALKRELGNEQTQAIQKRIEDALLVDLRMQ
jgi:parvulin-like peptidyl-prolyl isomerase